jgi:hypothetical protein
MMTVGDEKPAIASSGVSTLKSTSESAAQIATISERICPKQIMLLKCRG